MHCGLGAQGITQADIEAHWPQLAAGDALPDAINALLQGHRLELFHNKGGHLVYRATSAANAQKCAVPVMLTLLRSHMIAALASDGVPVIVTVPSIKNLQSAGDCANFVRVHIVSNLLFYLNIFVRELTECGDQFG